MAFRRAGTATHQLTLLVRAQVNLVPKVLRVGELALHSLCSLPPRSLPPAADERVDPAPHQIQNQGEWALPLAWAAQ